jgi:beta-phosphoglucomutase-like phosphatase (HAD superfamily)
LLGLDSGIPLIAAGHMIWLSARRNKGPRAYLKPSPVQALAAIGAAYTGQEKAALEAAAVLAEDGRLEGPLAQLKGRQTRCVVFEDAIGGIQAGQRAVEVLQAAGVEICFEGVGIASEESKREALSKVASRVVGNINEALAPYLSE